MSTGEELLTAKLAKVRKGREGSPFDVASSSECLWSVVLLSRSSRLKGFAVTGEELLTAKLAKVRKGREAPL